LGLNTQNIGQVLTNSFMSIPDPPIEPHKENQLDTEINKLERITQSTLDWQNFFLKWQRQWKSALGIFLLIFLFTSIAASLLKKHYQARGKILFKIDNSASLTGVGKNVGELKALLNNQSPLITEIEVIRSNPLLQETIEQLDFKDKKGRLLDPQKLKQHLQVQLINSSDIVQISYDDVNPYTAADFVNVLMNVYLSNKIGNNRDRVQQAREFISKELPNLDKKVSRAENELLEFKQKNNVIALDKEEESIIIGMANLNSQIADLQAKMRGIESQISILQTQLGLTLNEALAIDRLRDSPKVAGILNRTKKVEKELSDRLGVLKSNHPQVINLQETKSLLDRQLQQEIGKVTKQKYKVVIGLLKVRNIKQNILEKLIELQTRRIDISQQLKSFNIAKLAYEKRAKTIPQLEQKQKYLTRKINETLLNNFQVVRVTENRETVNARIIETAGFPEASRSDRFSVMAGGTLLALLLAQLTISIAESKDKTLKTVSEVKNIFDYNLLGLIPLQEKPKDYLDFPIIVLAKPEAFESELYRMIQVKLRLFNLARQAKVILVTSSVSNEGKSTIAANLATAIVQTKRRVLLIDGDFRNPSQTILWTQLIDKRVTKSNTQFGLSDVLSGKVNLSEAIYSPIPRLDLVTTGQTKVNPLTLIDSGEMDTLLEELKQNYETIIIDAPPLLATADVISLSKMADGIVFVSRLGAVEKETAIAARENLVNSGQQVLGLIINGVDRQEFDRYLYYDRKYYRRGSLRKKSVFLRSAKKLEK
jgi:polysaccharide biosynthesis transport protein